jgi:hypothetical protein
MSLLDLRDRHIDPAIDNKEIQLGNLLHSSLFIDEVSPADMEDLTREISELVVLKETINQHRHKSNSSEFLQGIYRKATELGLEVMYAEREISVADASETETELQLARRKTRKPKPTPRARKPTPKPRPRAEEPPAAVPIGAPVKKKLVIKAITGYRWRSDTYKGTKSNLKYKSKIFTKLKKELGLDNESVDAVMHAIREGSRPIADQDSSSEALTAIFGAGAGAEAMIQFHQQMKEHVFDQDK